MGYITGKQAFLQILKQEGVSVMFGNPGTTELPLMDGLAREPGIHYVLALQEAVAIAMADAYAQARTGGQPRAGERRSVPGRRENRPVVRVSSASYRSRGATRSENRRIDASTRSCGTREPTFIHTASFVKPMTARSSSIRSMTRSAVP